MPLSKLVSPFSAPESFGFNVQNHFPISSFLSPAHVPHREPQLLCRANYLLAMVPNAHPVDRRPKSTGSRSFDLEVR